MTREHFKRITGRDIATLSTLATQPSEPLQWKQEVNRRLAEHKNRRTSGAVESTPSETYHAANPRVAQAAARVAARYAKAPSYNEMLAEEARAALRAAEAATEVARQAQFVAESVLAEIETAVAARPEFDPPAAQRRESPAAQGSFFDPFLEVERPVAHDERSALEIRWDPDLPVRLAEPDPSARRQFDAGGGAERDDWRAAYGEPETVEPAQPIAANLIEFPRELIAARRARPRIAEGPLGAEDAQPGQLSIFEVEPGAISVEPELPVAAATEPAMSGWSRIRLDAERAPEAVRQAAHERQAHRIELAPVGLRLMSATIDTALVASVFVAVGMMVASNIDSPVPMKTMEIAGGLALFALGVVYQAFFFTMAKATPGMRYAGLSLCTFDHETPTREQLRRRVGALVLSVLPVGLGLLWAIFDEDHLSWHDRISKTYQRWG